MRWLYKTWVKVIAGVMLAVVFIIAVFYLRFQPAETISWGVTYSPTYAEYLGLDPVVTFNDLLNDLHPAHVRLVTYWETLETQPGQIDFASVDRLLGLATTHGTDVVLIIGHKQPRWPECHHPAWYESLNPDQQRQAVLDFVEAEVNHFKTFAIISRWQVENEPLFPYGDNCPLHTRAQLREEINLVKGLDSRPVILTDSGEKGDWFRVASLADIFGSTMYRTVYNPNYGGYVSYHLPPAFYRVRAGMLQLFTGTREIIGVELQAEPWFARDINDTTLEEQYELMNAQKLADNVNYARQAGFAENYLWGAEWWYWLKNKHDDPSLVEAARKVFQP